MACGRAGAVKWERLEWVLTDAQRANVRAAEAHAKKLASTVDGTVSDFDSFGGAAISQAKCPPDAFVQMALQLAYWRVHGEAEGVPAPTYETAHTRQYFHGRTETIRSCTSEALAFCKAMNSEVSWVG